MEDHNSQQIKKVSVVIPVYNEESNIQGLYNELKIVLEGLGLEYEIIFVDDFSQDNSLQILKYVFDSNPRVQIISLLGHHGQTITLAAGFKRTCGDVILAMDGDGQHDPKYIPEFIKMINEGHDVVGGWKQSEEENRKVSIFLSKIAHKIISKTTGIKMRYFGATMKAYKKKVLENLELTGDLHRFAGALVYYEGIKIKEIPITIRRRKSGKPNYTLSKISKVLLDLILIKFLTKYARTPFRIFGTLGSLLCALGIGGIIYVFGSKYLLGVSTLGNTSILIIASLCFVAGVQLIFFGLMSEMITKVYYSSCKEPYVIKQYLRH